MEKLQRQMYYLEFREEIEFMDLPWGIICTILSRLPLKSIGQFMCVSKSFRGIKNDSYFVELHTRNAKFQQLSYILKENPEFAEYRMTRYSFGKPDVQLSDPAKTLYLVGEGKHNVNITTKIPIIAEVQDEMLRLVGSCNGLLCFSKDKEGPLSDSIIIYNPITREYMPVPTTFANVGKKYINVSISFVFDVISKKFKVVILYPEDRNGKGMEVYIITLGESSWRKSNLPFGLKFSKYTEDNNRSVLWNESLCWIMKKKTGSASMKVILTMDISTEKFQEVYLNDPELQNPPTLCTHYFLLNSGKSLELAAHDYSDKQKRMNVWGLMDGKRGIWSHQSTHHLGSFLECKRDQEKYSCAVKRNAGDDSLLVEFDYFDESMRGTTYVLGPGFHHLICYTPKDKKFSIDIVSEIEIPDFFDVFTFSPSFVSPKF